MINENNFKYKNLNKTIIYFDDLYNNIIAIYQREFKK